MGNIFNSVINKTRVLIYQLVQERR